MAASAAVRTMQVAGVTEVAGREVSLPVQLIAQGDENALSFSLGFAPERLTFQRLTEGAGVVGAAFYVNTNQLVSGQLGFALARPGGQRFAAGTNELFRLRLTLGTNTGPAEVTFTDTPVERETVNDLAVPLATIYSNGVVWISPLYLPVIVASPTNRIVYSGTNVSFSVMATGSPPLFFQWLFNGANIVAATNTSLSLTNVTLSHSGEYQAIASNAGGSVTSTPALLTVHPAPIPPSFLAQPQSWVASVGESAVFSALATGTEPLRYQWRFNNGDLAGETNRTLVMTNLTTGRSGSYSVRVSNAGGSVTSAGASLSVSATPRLLRLGSRSVATGLNVDLPLELVGLGDENAVSLSLGFDPARLNFRDISLGSSAVGANLLLNTNELAAGRLGAALIKPAGERFAVGVSQLLQVQFRAGNLSGSAAVVFTHAPLECEIADVWGNPRPLGLSNGLVTVLSTPPSITAQPQSRTNYIFSPVTFAVSADGSLPLSYQWQFNGINLPGQTNAMLLLPGVRPGQSGSYRVVVTNLVAGVTSSVATLTVPRLVRVVGTNAPTGNALDVPVQLLVEGDENAVGFSLRFDPNRLRFLQVVSNTWPVGAVLNVNLDAAAGGTLGFAAAMGFGQTFAAGTQQLARVRFEVGQLAGETAIAFSDSLIPRELVNGAAEPLWADFVSGTVTAQLVPPEIVQQPAGQEVLQGTAVSFSVVARGSLPLMCQWQRNGSDLPGATNSTLTLSNVLFSSAGSYSARVSNAAGATNSAAAILIVRPPPGDLSVPELNVPMQIIAGQPVTFTWMVTNHGTAVAVAPWSDTLYVADNVQGTAAQALSSFTFYTPISTNESMMHTGVVILPLTAGGAKYFGVMTDSGYQVPEADELNNWLWSTNPVPILVPDLQPGVLTGSASAQFGDSITLSWSVTNIGSTAAIASWNDRVFLSKQSDSVAGATALATVPVGTNSPLAPGTGYTRTVSVTVPLSSSMTPGTYYLWMMADYSNQQPESNDTNNLVVAPITLFVPPLPDLAVRHVSAPLTAQPGHVLAVSWVVTNQGPARAAGLWSETIGVSNQLSGEQTLLMLSATNALEPEGWLLRTLQVALPVALSAGSNWFIIRVDSLNEIVEQNEANNAGLPDSSTLVPAQLSLQLPLTQIPESTTSPVMHAVLSRNGSLASPLTVTSRSSDTNTLSVPASVIIPANHSSVELPLTVHQDFAVGPDKIVTVTASATGYQGSSADLTILNADLPRLILELSASSMVEGQAVIATITREFLISNALDVLVNSATASQISTPTVVSIPPGAASTNFLVVTPDDTLINAPRTFHLSANAPGFQGATNSFVILDNDMPTLEMTLNKTNVSEGDGPMAAMLTLHRSPITARSLVVALESSDPGSLLVPGQVIIPAGSDAFSFPVAAVDDDWVEGPRQVLIHSYITDSTSGARLAEAASAAVTVQDNDGPALTLRLAQKVVPEGLNPATTATVARNASTNGELVVQLFSSLTNASIVPDNVIIPAGATSAVFNVISIHDGIPQNNQSVVISASATNYAPGSDTLVVTDVDLPDLTVSAITLPPAGLTATYAPVSYRVINQGLSAAGSNMATRILLSNDPLLGNDQWVGDYPFAGSIPPGQYFEQAVLVRMPQASGDYWIIVQTDVNSTILELQKGNNTTISATPIHVRAAYEAVVSTCLPVAPAGTPIPFSGHAWMAGTSLPPPAFSMVNIHIHVRGTHRIISALTGPDGNFAVLWTPLPGEAGFYEIAAAHPGEPDAATEATFTLLGLRTTPADTYVRLTEGSGATNFVRLQNGSPIPLTGFAATVLAQPDNLGVSITVPGTLGGDASAVLACTIVATNASVAHGLVQLRVTVNEGLSKDLNFHVIVDPLRPQLVVSPVQLQAGMARGAQTFVEFSVANVGGSNSGPLTVFAPEAPWLRIASINPLPPLAPHGTNRVTLQLMPENTLPLGDYPGTLLVSDGSTWINVPFHFRAVSEAKCDLLVTVQDEYTFYAAGAPNLSNAAVLVRDTVTGAIVTNGVSGPDGTLLVRQIQEGYYDIQVDALQHIGYRDTRLLVAGDTNHVTAFLSRQTVQYRWTVVPTEVEDRTRITIETTFETVVPVPVVTIEPALIDLSQVTGDNAQIDLHISNHGLIAAENFWLHFDSHPNWELAPLMTYLGALPANSAYTIPLLVRRLGSTNGASATFRVAARNDASAPASCTISGGGSWELTCGEKKNYYTPITVINAATNCGGVSTGGGNNGGSTGGGEWGGIYTGGGSYVGDCCGGGTGGTWGGGSGGNGTPDKPYVSKPIYTPKTVCDCGLLPKICLGHSISVDLDGLASKLAKIALKHLPSFRLVDSSVTLNLKGEVCTCCTDNTLSYDGGIKGSADLTLVLAAGPGLSEEMEFDAPPDWEDVEVKFDTLLGVEITLSGSIEVEYARECNDGTSLCTRGQVGLGVFAGAKIEAEVSATSVQSGITYSGGIDGQLGLEGTLTVKVEGCAGTNTTFTVCGQLNAKCHLQGEIMATLGDGSISYEEIGPNADTNIVSLGECESEEERNLQSRIFRPAQFSGTNDVESVPTREFLRPEQEVLAALLGSQAQQQVGVCAQVRLRLDQEAVLTRDAFKATLELDNNSDTSLQNIKVEVVVRNAAGQEVTGLFGLSPPTLSVMTGVDGTGTLGLGASGSAVWIILPSIDAAPTAPLQHFVTGTLRYTQDGLAVAVPLAAAPITVHPLPQLAIDYFHQRDVYADDPFTSEIEPSLPFSLAVMIRNTGYGLARDFRITSAQPRIVDNERGLLIDFKVLATEVAGQGISPSLTARFGDIAPGSNVVGRWLLTSTLQGLFVDYSATFENLDILGNKRLAIVTNVSIHEMIRLVQATGAFDDGKPDLLVNDVPDPRDLPDALYLSDGRTQRLQVVEQAQHDGPPSAVHLQVSLSASMPSGWTYLRVPEPSDGGYRLVSVRGSDGRTIAMGTNAWVTDRTFIGMGRRPIRENIFHLLDYDSTGLYTLAYEAVPAADTTAPVSQVAMLPEISYRRIPVNWAGHDDAGGSGLVGYDIFVSANGGSFTRWLERTTLNGSVYFGEFGSRYAFYSVAIDQSGNLEIAPITPDAATSVSLRNRAPTLASVTNLSLDEGNEFTLALAAADLDASDVLTFSLVSTPAGMTLSPATGWIRWATGEGNGPSTNLVVVQVQDNGDPPLGSTNAFVLVVHEINTPPTLASIASRTNNEGRLLVVTNTATDYDLPANRLTFSLGAGAPQGAEIDPISGIFRWRPTETQGPSTNRISVMVADDGQPSLSATQTFVVIVRDTMSDFLVASGTTNLLVGESNSVLLRLRTGEELMDYSFVLELSEERMTNLALQVAIPESASVTWLHETPGVPGRFKVRVQAQSGQAMQGELNVLRLDFQAVPHPHSAMVPVQVQSVEGTSRSGVRLANGRGLSGRVFIIAAEPLLDAFLTTNGMRSLVLYGQPESDWLIQHTTNLTAGAAWTPWRHIHLEGTFALMESVDAILPNVFYRAIDLDGAGLRLKIWREDADIILEWPAEIGECAVEETASLVPPVQWTPAAGSAQRTGDTFRLAKPVGTAARFYRLACPPPGH